MQCSSQWRSHAGPVCGVLISALVLLVPCGSAVAYDKDPEFLEDVARYVEVFDSQTTDFRTHYDAILTEQELWDPQIPRPELWTALLVFEDAVVDLDDEIEEPSDDEQEELAYLTEQLFQHGKHVDELVKKGDSDDALVKYWGEIYASLRRFARKFSWPETAGWDSMPEWKAARDPVLP